uniref:Uncharacterized protein n=1 Tax=Clandestinovirus TaxID=2831644 RepID=A0A8F8KL25_9VIRU|nr:hypothetical protein KOM_12_390 [Clandestinovirus]
MYTVTFFSFQDNGCGTPMSRYRAAVIFPTFDESIAWVRNHISETFDEYDYLPNTDDMNHAMNVLKNTNQLVLDRPRGNFGYDYYLISWVNFGEELPFVDETNTQLFGTHDGKVPDHVVTVRDDECTD